MALNLFLNSGLTNQVSEAGALTNPVATSHDGAVGEAKDTQVWLGNADATKQYTAVSVVPLDTAGTDEKGWVRLALTQAGLDSAVGGASLALSNMSGVSNQTFWTRVTVPASTATQTKTDLRVKITYTESPV